MLKTVLISLLAVPALQGASAGQADTGLAEPPVRVWLNDDKLEPGDRARVHVRTSEDGYLVVLHADPEARVRVLFPLDPGDDNFVRGSEDVEIRGRGGRHTFTAGSIAGTGVVYAAVSPDPFRFDPFVRGDHWDYQVLGDSAVAQDAEAALTDIVQRMTSEGRFDYDLVTYEVARSVADARDRAPYADYRDPPYGSVYDQYGYWYDPWFPRLRDRWYDPYHSPFYGSSFGLRLSFGAPWHRFYFRSGFGHPVFYDPFFYDPFFYDPFFYDPFYYGWYYGYRPWGYYGYRPWGYRRPIGYVYVNRPRDRYTFKPRVPIPGGIGYRDRAITAPRRLTSERSSVIRPRPRGEIAGTTPPRTIEIKGPSTIQEPSSIGSRDRRVIRSGSGRVRSPDRGSIESRDRRPIEASDGSSRRLAPAPSARPAPQRIERPSRIVRPSRPERLDRIERPSRMDTPSRVERPRDEPRRVEPMIRRAPMPSSIDRRSPPPSSGRSWSRPASPRSGGGFSRPAGGYGRPAGGYARPSGGGHRRP